MWNSLLTPLILILVGFLGGWHVGKSVRLEFSPISAKALSLVGRTSRNMIGVIGGLLAAVIAVYFGYRNYGQTGSYLLIALGVAGLILGFAVPPAFWLRLSRSGWPALLGNGALFVAGLAVTVIAVSEGELETLTPPIRLPDLSLRLIMGPVMAIIGLSGLVSTVQHIVYDARLGLH